MVRRKHLRKESDPYLIIEGPRLDNAESMMDFAVARNDLCLQLCTWAGGLVARRTPQPELVASLDDELGSVARGFAELELEVREAA